MISSKIGLVTVLYNSEKVLFDFFDSLNKQTYKDFILYVIDNNSTDNCLKKAKELSSNVFFETKFIPNKDNYGVAKGNNQGIINALKDECDNVLICNNDIVLSPNTIEVLLDEMNKNKVQLIVPKIYFYNSQRLWFGGGKFKIMPGSIKHYGYGTIDSGKYDGNILINYAPTCFMLVKKDVFYNTGLMDEKYFVYFDDTDFIFRAIKKNGNKLLYCPKTFIQHKESFSTGGTKSDFTLKYYYRNKLYFIKKYYKFYKLFYLFNRIYFSIKRHFIGNDMYIKIIDSLKSGLIM